MFPTIDAGPEHIVFRFSGVRPLPSADAKTAGQISRDHANRIIEPSERFPYPIFNLVGGKWTTFRAFSEQVTDAALDRIGRPRQASTRTLPIGGGANYPNTEGAVVAWIDDVVRQTEQAPQRVRQLFDRYGTRAADIAAYCSEFQSDEPLINQPTYSTGEIAFLTNEEGAARLSDMVLRRTVLGMMGYLTGPMLQQIADVMGQTLGWSPDQRDKELSHTLNLLKERHQVELNQA